MTEKVVTDERQLALRFEDCDSGSGTDEVECASAKLFCFQAALRTRQEKSAASSQIRERLLDEAKRLSW